MMARWLYSLVLYLLMPLILLHLWRRGKKAPAYRQRWSERFGKVGAAKIRPGGIVFHCASVGEVVATTPLIKQVQQQYPDTPVLVTCNTPTGTEQIKRAFGDSVQHVYLPMDFPHAVSRFLSRVKPKLLCIVETELWPNLFSHSQANDIPVMVINARLSEKSMQGYQKIAPLTRVIMKGISQLAAHDAQDAERFIQLGLAKNKVVTTGSIKFDININDEVRGRAERLKQQHQANHPVWIAGSTHPGEDELLLEVHKEILVDHPDALLILVPRHPEEFDNVAGLVAEMGLSLQRRSAHSNNHSNSDYGNNEKPACQVLLGDTMGELLTLYGAADVAFIGGSLIERGGHNPLEAAAYGMPVITGPHVFNFLHVYPALLKAQGCLQISAVDELPTLLLQLFNSHSRSERIGGQGVLFVEKNQGAIAKTTALIGAYL